MDLLISSDVFTRFFENHNKVSKSEIDKFLTTLFYNDSIRFVISRSLLDVLESKVKDTPLYDTIYVPLISHILDNQSINIKADKNTDEKEIHVSMANNYENKPSNEKRDVFLHITNSSLSLGKIYSIEIDKVLFANKHYIGLNLACNNKIAFRYFHFDNNKKITDIVSFLIGIQTRIPAVYVYDRYINLDHSFFLSFQRSNLVYYYTMNRSGSDYYDMIDNLKSSFNNVKLFTASRNLIHERRIIVNNTIFEADEDFWELKIDRPTWKISIEYSNDVVSQLLNKNVQFREKRVR